MIVHPKDNVATEVIVGGNMDKSAVEEVNQLFGIAPNNPRTALVLRHAKELDSARTVLGALKVNSVRKLVEQRDDLRAENDRLRQELASTFRALDNCEDARMKAEAALATARKDAAEKAARICDSRAEVGDDAARCETARILGVHIRALAQGESNG